MDLRIKELPAVAAGGARSLHGIGGKPQQRVAVVLAVQVANGLKTIQVDQHQRHLRAAARGALQARCNAERVSRLQKSHAF